MINTNKKAFTFAELMIVLALIGIIASFMIPALVKVEPDETALTYKKVFYAIEEAVSNIINDTALYPTFDHDATGELENITGDLRHKNEATTDASGNVTEYALDANGAYLCRNLADNMNTIGQIKCPPSDVTDLKIANGGTLAGDENLTVATTNFTLTNGASIGGIVGTWDDTMDDGNTHAEIPFITLCVDVNGNEAPNVGCKISDRAHNKRDQFRIRLNAQGKVYTDSPVGKNNWFLENKMLINPRAVTKDKKEFTEREKTELTNETSNTEISKTNCPEDLGYILHNNDLCVYTAGFDANTIQRKKKAKKDEKNKGK